MPSRPKHRCTGSPICPVMLPAGVRYCTEHQVVYEERRGTRQQRGYDAAHEHLRREWQRRIDSGEVVWCADGCGVQITPSMPWHLGHTADRTGYVGPMTVAHNTSDGGRRGAAARF